MGCRWEDGSVKDLAGLSLLLLIVGGESAEMQAFFDEIEKAEVS